jgi:hypothetical protein
MREKRLDAVDGGIDLTLRSPNGWPRALAPRARPGEGRAQSTLG